MATLSRSSRRVVAHAWEWSDPARRPVYILIREDYRPLPRDSDAHEPFELAILLAGRQRRFFAGYQTELLPGDVSLSPPWEPHGWQSLMPHTTILNIHFAAELLGDETFDGMSWLALFACPPDERPSLPTDELRRESLAVGERLARGAGPQHLDERRPVDTLQGRVEQAVGRETWVDRNSPDLPPAWEAGVRLDVLQLLLLLFRCWHPGRRSGTGDSQGTGSLARIMPAVRLAMTQQSRGRRVSEEEAAGACRMSASGFRKVFRRTMGTTFGKFEVQQRLSGAYHLLLQSDLPVAAVAERFGFADASHFHRVFLRWYGTTPGEHRLQRSAVRSRG